jgi:outer membrane protein assembly factor BamE (lipoprotein component of BamABCDE complex)
MILTFALLASAGCMAAKQHRGDVRDDSGDKLTVGTVQKEIKVGMSSADVAAILGAPNMVTTDTQRREVWIYDKVSTEHVYSSSSGGVGVLGLVFGGAGGAAGSGSYSGSSGAASSTQRTLTIIIKYDENNLVRDFAYRQSSF